MPHRPFFRRDRAPEFDFLSSIELVVVDQADVLLMQNWDHVEAILSQLNLLPKSSHSTDFSRVHNWQLNAWYLICGSVMAGMLTLSLARGKYYRQTLIFAAFQTIEMNAILNRSCYSIERSRSAGGCP